MSLFLHTESNTAFNTKINGEQIYFANFPSRPQERSNLLDSDVLVRCGESADGVHLESFFFWNKFSLQKHEEKNTYFHICQERNKQNTAADQSGAIRAGVGLGQGRQGRDQGPGSHPWGERWMAANTFHKMDKYI